jgi:hypothetical protein
MPQKVHEVKIKIQGSKDYLKAIKKNLNQIFTDEVSPEMYEGIRDIFLYRKMPMGFTKKIDVFMASHAGLFSASIVRNVKASVINYGNSKTYAVVDQPKKIPELVLSLAVTKEVADKFEQANKDEEAIFKLVTKLDEATTKRIFDEALKEMGKK